MMDSSLKETSTRRGRDVSVDIIKGIAIVLVIYAHTWPFCKNFIRFFNLPIFMVTSGYCFKNRIGSWADWRRYMAGKLRTLFLPCALCNGIFTLLTGVFLRLGLYTGDPAFLTMTADWPVPQRLHTVQGIGDLLWKLVRVLLLTDTTQMGTGTWFLIMLFAASAFHGAFCCLTARLTPRRRQAAMTALFLLTAVLAQFSDPLFIGSSYAKCALYFYLTYLFGLLLREPFVRRLETPLLSCLSFAVLLVLARYYYIDVATGSVAGVLPYLAGVLCGWLLLKPAAGYLARQDRLSRIFCYLGRHTISVICLHILCFKPVTWLYIRACQLPKIYLASFHVDFDVSEPWKLLYLAAGVILPLLLAALWRCLRDRIRLLIGKAG